MDKNVIMLIASASHKSIQWLDDWVCGNLRWVQSFGVNTSTMGRRRDRRANSSNGVIAAVYDMRYLLRFSSSFCSVILNFTVSLAL